MHSDRNAVRPSSRSRLAVVLALGSSALFLTACGSNYRPVISSISPVGPAGQPTKYAIAISAPSATSAGLVNIIDFSGDTVLATVAIGVNPKFLALNGANPSSTAFTLNGDGTVNSFNLSTALIQSQVNQTTLPTGANPSSITASNYIYITQPGLDSLAQLSTGSPPVFTQALPTGANTVYTIAAYGTPRAFALVQNGNSAGHAAAIETTNANNTLSNNIPTGVTPVYGVMTADARRAFVMNKGSNTVTVIDSQTNALDSFAAYPNGTIPVGTAPVWADLAPTLDELLVLNQGNGTGKGSVTVINIPLCNVTSVATNPNCDPNNPVDATAFGQVLATIPVGVNPQQIAVAQDGSYAYISNQGIIVPGNPAADVAGSISVIDLTTDTVVATIPALSVDINPSDAYVHGNPGFIAVTTGLPTGKLYVTSPNSNDLTIISTDTNTVTAHLSLQGAGVMVRVNAP